MVDGRVSKVDCLADPPCFDLCLYHDQLRTAQALQSLGSRIVRKACVRIAPMPILRLLKAQNSTSLVYAIHLPDLRFFRISE